MGEKPDVAANGRWITYGSTSRLPEGGAAANLTLIDIDTREKCLLLEGDQAALYSHIQWNMGWSSDSREIIIKVIAATLQKLPLRPCTARRQVFALSPPELFRETSAGTLMDTAFCLPVAASCFFTTLKPGRPGDFQGSHWIRAGRLGLHGRADRCSEHSETTVNPLVMTEFLSVFTEHNGQSFLTMLERESFLRGRSPAVVAIRPWGMCRPTRA